MRRSEPPVLVLFTVLIGLWCTIAPAAGGQSPDARQQVPPRSGYKVQVRVNTVFLNVSVRDRKGYYATEP